MKTWKCKLAQLTLSWAPRKRILTSLVVATYSYIQSWKKNISNILKPIPASNVETSKSVDI